MFGATRLPAYKESLALCVFLVVTHFWFYCYSLNMDPPVAKMNKNF